MIAPANPLEARLDEGFKSDVPRIYLDGFVMNLSHGGVGIVLECNNIPVGVLNMSFELAKTLGEGLTSSIERLEHHSEYQIMTVSEIDSALVKIRKSN